MSIWLIRAGAHGEYEPKFLQENRVYATWDALDVDLSKLPGRPVLADAMSQRYRSDNPRSIANQVGQVWPFAHEIRIGDLVVLPLKTQRAIQMGEITGDYHFEPEGPNRFYHWRSVKWLGEPVPRDHFGKDLLNTFGAFLTICRVRANNAEARIAAMRANGWQPESITSVTRTTAPAVAVADADADAAAADINLEDRAGDQIAQLIMARFKGHGLTRLVEAILKAQGYTTYLSPEGADGGVDILAGAGPLGFGRPRLCVEVKSESSPIDRPTVDKLIGAIDKFRADEGLFVSWSGFKTNVQKELAGSFFRVRLWSQKELLEGLYVHYDDFDDDIKAELPLKRIWTVATPDDA